jgi:DeoR/GlpR family transcriptional regulator of sugar metabolism
MTRNVAPGRSGTATSPDLPGRVATDPGDRRPATANERRERIARLIEHSGRVTVTDLVERFGVTDVSIRRDLDMLEDAGRLRRVHGGATAIGRGDFDRGYHLRAREHRDEKVRIGARAASMIQAGDVVVLDSGTTVAQVAARVPGPLRRSSAIAVVTNSLPVIDEVGSWDSPHLICLGGLYLPEYQAMVGPQTVEDMRDLSGTIAFIGCDGLTAATGLTTPHVLVAEVGAMMTARAQRVVAVADGSKIGRRGLTPIAPIDAIDVLVTDASADPEELERAREIGIEVVLV